MFIFVSVVKTWQTCMHKHLNNCKKETTAVYFKNLLSVARQAMSCEPLPKA